MSNFWQFVIAAGFMAALFIVGTHFNRARFSRPHEFQFEGETYIWVPDPEEDRPFGQKLYEHGSFQYSDGEPVSDRMMIELLNNHWVKRNRLAETDFGHSN